MPTYDFRCGWCGKEVERNVRIEMRDEQTCDNELCHNFNQPLDRRLTFNGWVWHPSVNV